MKIEQSSGDFMGSFLFKINNFKERDFNVLFLKETILTDSSVICYVVMNDIVSGPNVTKVIKVYYSKNPSVDIQKDKSIFGTFDKIIIRSQVSDGESLENLANEIKEFYYV